MAEPPELQWGTLLCLLRTLRGWSQQDLARAAGVSLSSITRQEGGLIPKPSVREKVERALGVEGRARDLQLHFGSVRALLDRPHGSEWGAADAAAAADAAKNLIATALLAAIAGGAGGTESEASDDAPKGETPETAKLPMGFDELQRERQARRKARQGDPEE